MAAGDVTPMIGAGLSGQIVSSGVVLTAVGAAPADGRLTADLRLSLDVSFTDSTNTVRTKTLLFTLTADATNTSSVDLAADLAAALNAALVSGGFIPGAVSGAVKLGRLGITVNDSTISGIRLHGATAIGFGVDQSSLEPAAFIDSPVAFEKLHQGIRGPAVFHE